MILWVTVASITHGSKGRLIDSYSKGIVQFVSSLPGNRPSTQLTMRSSELFIAARAPWEVVPPRGASHTSCSSVSIDFSIVIWSGLTSDRQDAQAEWFTAGFPERTCSGFPGCLLSQISHSLSVQISMDAVYHVVDINEHEPVTHIKLMKLQQLWFTLCCCTWTSEKFALLSNNLDPSLDFS